MGYNEIPGMKDVIFKDLSAGWFPGKEHNDIPGDLRRPTTPAGMFDGNAVVWDSGTLQSMWGYDNVNTVALNSAATLTSLYASDVLDEFVATAGDKLYSGADQAAPTDITGSITITADKQIHWAEWQYETTKYIIGVNGTDAPFKWTGSGNASVLGGSPPTARWVAVFQNAVWLARTSTEPSTIYFSDLADPETYTTNYDYKFDAPITGVGVLNDKLVVFKDDSIGVLSGTNNLLLTKVDKYIDGIGCSGGHTIVNAKIRGREVLVFHSYDGWYAFDGSQNLISLSHPISGKYRDLGSVTKWNQSRFEYAWATYIPQYKWYMCCLSDGSDSTNDFMIILDLDRVYETKEGIYVPHWPVDSIPGNCIARSKRIDSEANQIYFGDTTGFIYKFDPSLFNYNGSAYTKYYQSKIYDNIQTWVLGEFNILGNENNVELSAYVRADLEVGDGEMGSVSLLDDADVLGTSFILGTSVLGGKDFVFEDAAIDSFGRFLQFKISNATIDKSFEIEEINLLLQEIGLAPNAKQE